MKTISRKKFITTAALAAVGVPLGLNTLGKTSSDHLAFNDQNNTGTPAAEKIRVSIFSKHLHWLNYTDMAALAAEMGFDGVDLTVRPDGHVLPENVTADLPKAVAAVEKAGLKVYSIVTNIKQADEKYAADILKAASALGIKYYRTAWFNYDKALSVPVNLQVISKQLAGLAALNKQYHMHGAYQNHSGDLFGASVWDLWLALKDLDPASIGCQYDIRHATTEGADTWATSIQPLVPFIKTTNIKDFYWEKKDGKWQVKSVPLGEGMVDFKNYFEVVKQQGIGGPMSLHCEYELGGAQDGAKQLTISKQQFTTAVQKDLSTLRGWLKDHAL
ncbi:Sugar phosphate isomerase/epimerase [Mucilaginibacter lappiensis]|uniref:Sugar phosphate isomerase/epimerase n=1 Tax=Mucilaginibacter lappiensis TaxID=354630 RepID=A0ABR6PJC1_9SPHI|nr:sugar phosphate isomerase/epimerase family protein [Mucilaginibacter lappiensis]MBB6109877.1 sugar phosphate isomerase/epimerase [Mucilaginibacter lappiensis]SIR18710.1 Sugar phosphate isomerase/epimerase [Mucilaginibacter lappiensis]